MPPDLKDVLMLAIMNPAAIAVGFLVGRRADQRQKIVLAGLVAGIAGVAFALLLMMTGLTGPKVRLLGGVFVGSGLVGLVCAWLGFTTKKDEP